MRRYNGLFGGSIVWPDDFSGGPSGLTFEAILQDTTLGLLATNREWWHWRYWEVIVAWRAAYPRFRHLETVLLQVETVGEVAVLADLIFWDNRRLSRRFDSLGSIFCWLTPTKELWWLVVLIRAVLMVVWGFRSSKQETALIAMLRVQEYVKWLRVELERREAWEKFWRNITEDPLGDLETRTLCAYEVIWTLVTANGGVCACVGLGVAAGMVFGGEVLLPALNRVLRFLSSYVDPMLTVLFSYVAPMLTALKGIFGSLWVSFLYPTLKWLFGPVWDVGGALIASCVNKMAWVWENYLSPYRRFRVPLRQPVSGGWFNLQPWLEAWQWLRGLVRSGWEWLLSYLSRYLTQLSMGDWTRALLWSWCQLLFDELLRVWRLIEAPLQRLFDEVLREWRIIEARLGHWFRGLWDFLCKLFGGGGGKQ